MARTSSTFNYPVLCKTLNEGKKASIRLGNTQYAQCPEKARRTLRATLRKYKNDGVIRGEKDTVLRTLITETSAQFILHVWLEKNKDLAKTRAAQAAATTARWR